MSATTRSPSPIRTASRGCRASSTNFIRNNPIVRSIVQIASTILLNAVLPGLGFVAGSLGLAAAAAAGGAAIATGLSGGNLGQILRAGATAAAFFGVGEVTNGFAGANPDPITGAHGIPTFGSDAYAVNVAGHALVGCASSAASGGSCGSGALSGGLGAAAGPALTNLDFGGRLVVSATLGGVGSVAGGGKFANGAVTGAFGYLFNAAAGRLIGGYIGAAVVGALGIESGPGAALAAVAGRFVGGELGSRLEDALWGNPDTLQGHFDKHGSDFSATDPIDYANQAQKFFESNVGVSPTKVDPSTGVIRVYDPTTNTFGSYNPDGSTRTLFKPSSPNYFDRQPGTPQ